jgi:hypothetical protein
LGCSGPACIAYTYGAWINHKLNISLCNSKPGVLEFCENVSGSAGMSHSYVCFENDVKHVFVDGIMQACVPMMEDIGSNARSNLELVAQPVLLP